MKRTLALAVLLLAAVSLVAAEFPEVGTAAPDFKLTSEQGKVTSLADFHGKWVVLYFYPKDMTPGCTTQACEFRDNIFEYRNIGAVILGVSVDDVESHKAFSDEHSLPFPILADVEKKVATSYGTLTKYLGIAELARRDTFIISPQGKIAKHYMKVEPKGHSAIVLGDLKQLVAKAAAAKAS
jgi:thioredoxin-dependent peroxiredoxin